MILSLLIRPLYSQLTEPKKAVEPQKMSSRMPVILTTKQVLSFPLAIHLQPAAPKKASEVEPQVMWSTQPVT
jgi:hypothetical protein